MLEQKSVTFYHNEVGDENRRIEKRNSQWPFVLDIGVTCARTTRSVSCIELDALGTALQLSSYVKIRRIRFGEN